MSAPTVVVTPTDNVPGVSWRSLAWVTWRRHRATLLGTVAVLAVIGIYLVVTGERMRSAWQTVDACTPQRSEPCRFAWEGFQSHYGNSGILAVVFIFAPLLIGAFAGAPLIGRELETGTFRYAWTQGVGRTRWAVAMLVSGAVGVAVVSGAFGALVSWHDNPLWRADVTPRLQASEFPATGVAVVGWSLAAYAVGVLAGLLWKRVVAALATTVVAMFLLAFATSRVRMHYLTPLRTSRLEHPVGSQPIDQWWEKNGVHVSTTQLNAALQAAGIQQIQLGNGKTTVHAKPGTAQVDPITYLLHHGYTQWTSYQPASRYWTFQWIELGWLAALAVILLVASVVVIRRRDA